VAQVDSSQHDGLLFDRRARKNYPGRPASVAVSFLLLKYLPVSNIYANFLYREISVNLSSLLFTKEGVDYVSKIQKLIVLAVKVVQERSLDFRNIIVQLAGRCPALKSFHLKHVHGQLWFVPMYGRLFPEKAQLVLCTLDVTKSFEFNWPENLVVAKLKIKAKVNDKTILKVIYHYFIY